MKKKLLLLIFTIFTFVNIFNIHQLNAVGIVYQGIANYESGAPTILYRTSAKPSTENIIMLKNRGVAYNTWDYSNINIKVASTPKTYEARYLIFTKNTIGDYSNATTTKGSNAGYGYLQYSGDLGLKEDKNLGEFFQDNGETIVLKSSEGTVKYIDKNEDIDKWLFDYSSITNNNYTVVSYDSSKWNDYLENIYGYGTEEPLNSFVNVFKDGSLIKWTSIANNNINNNWVYTKNITGKTLPGVPYTEYRMMLFNPSVVGNTSSVLENSVYVADMILDKNVTADLLSLGKKEVLVSTLSQTLTDQGEAWLVTPGSFLHGLTANYTSYNWSNMTRGVDADNDPFALGAGLNLWDNTLQLPTGGTTNSGKKTIVVNHINADGYGNIDRTDYYSVYITENGISILSDSNTKIIEDSKYHEMYSFSPEIQSLTIKTLKQLDSSKNWYDEYNKILKSGEYDVLGWQRYSTNDEDEFINFMYGSSSLSNLHKTENVVVKGNDIEDKYICINIFYKAKEAEPKVENYTLIERHVLVDNNLNEKQILKTIAYTLASNSTKTLSKLNNSYKYIGYEVKGDSGNYYSNTISYTWNSAEGNVTVTFKYKENEIVINQKNIPDLNLNGYLEIHSALGFNKTCDDIESVPGNAIDGSNDIEIGITGIPSYILGGVEVKDVTRSGTLTYKINMNFANKTTTWTIEVPYTASRIAIENILIYRLSNPTIYNTDKGYDTSGSSVFDWTSKTITNPNSLTYNKKSGSNDAKYMVYSPSAIYNYYYNYNNKEAHRVSPRYYKTWSDGYFYDNWTDGFGNAYTYYLPEIDITVDGNTLSEYSYIENLFNNNNKTVSINIDLLNTNVYEAIDFNEDNYLDEDDLTEIADGYDINWYTKVNGVNDLIDILDAAINALHNAWDALDDADRALEQAEANRIAKPNKPTEPTESDYDIDDYRAELQRNAFEKVYYYFNNGKKNSTMSKEEFDVYYNHYDETETDGFKLNQTSLEETWSDLKTKLNSKNYSSYDFLRFNYDADGFIQITGYPNSNGGTYEDNCKPYYNCLDRVEYEYIKNTSIYTAKYNDTESWSAVSSSKYADDHKKYVNAKEKYDTALREWEKEDEAYRSQLELYDEYEEAYTIANTNYQTALNTYNSELEAYNTALNKLQSLAKRENYAREYYDEAVALQETYNTYSKKTAKQMAEIFNLQIYLESTNDDARVGSNDIYNKSSFDMSKNGTFTISDLLAPYGTKVSEGEVKVETDYPRVNKTLYTDGFDFMSYISSYENNEFEIPKTKLNGERILAGYIKYKIDTSSDVGVGQDFNDNVYYDSSRAKQNVFKVNSNRIIEKNYGASKNNSQKFNIYTPLVVAADVELEQDVVDQTVNNPYSTTDVIQANSAFTINFKTNYKDVNRDNVYGVNKNTYADFTSRYKSRYYIRFDFDVNNVKYINEYGSMQTSAYVAKNIWIGPIYGDNITAVPYFSTSADESFGENANSYYIIAVAVNARESWTKLLKDYLTGDKTLENIVSEGNVSKIGDITNVCGNEPGDISYYADYEGKLAIINRMYDFRVTDVADVNWKNVFRENSSGSYVNQHSGLAYYAGLTKWNTVNTYKYNEIVGRTEEEIGSGSVLRILPVGPYKNTSSTYISAPRLGYKFSFDFKVTGATNNNKYVVITPSFYYISKDGKTFIENIDLYYKNSDGKYVKIGSSSDKYNIQFIPNDGYRALIKTEERNLSNKSISIGSLSKLILNFKEVSTYSGYSSSITYYGEYKLPNSTIAIRSGGNINNPLKDGYIGVRFDILANEANNGSDSTTLRYGKDALNDRPNTSQWDFEGYLGITDQGSSYSTTLRLEKGTWSIDNDTYNKIKGTVILYDLDHRASNDFN
ncbi:MAG: hypothetical protein IKV94_04530 [Clostridia bacterium]|nr:hypothetical protein [Clostridia bacterium]